MADDTPDTLNDEVETAQAQDGNPVPDGDAGSADAPAAADASGDDAPETIAEEVDTAQAQDGTPVPVGVVGEPGVPAAERRAARQTARDTAAGAQGPKTPEDREAARLERRRRNASQRRAYRAKVKAKRDERRSAEPATEAPEPTEHGPGRPKVRQGIVVSAKPDKTIVVRIDVARRHRRYGKIMRTSSKLHVHDERNDANEGDTVRVVESRPLSATKRWRLVDVLERAR